MTAQRSMQWRGGERLQNWATAWPMSREIERRFGMGGFNVDCCAEPWSAKCARFITKAMDALKIETHRAFIEEDPSLFGKLRGFWNPPFDNIEPFAQMARRLVELSIYVIDPEVDGARLSKTAQIRMCGNSVAPPVAAAIVAANFAEGRVRKGQLELGLSGAA